MVSKTIESAQSRVEGYNFDIRKRVVEFDDVINKQRETIYAERDKVLRNEDLGETVLRLPRRGDRRRSSSSISPATSPTSGTSRASRPRCGRWASTGRGPTEDELWDDRRRATRSGSTSATSSTPSSRQGAGGRRGRLDADRAARPAAHDRLAVGRAPHRARRHAPRASACAATPSRTRSTSSGARRSRCTRSCATSSATRSPTRSSG